MTDTSSPEAGATSERLGRVSARRGRVANGASQGRAGRKSAGAMRNGGDYCRGCLTTACSSCSRALSCRSISAVSCWVSNMGTPFWAKSVATSASVYPTTATETPLSITRLRRSMVAMRARQSMAIMLRLNRVIDKGVSVAVVGYTDALVATLFAQNGVPMFDTQQDTAEIERQLSALEQELHAVVKQPRQ